MIENSSTKPILFRRLAGRRWRKANFGKTSRCWVGTGGNNWGFRRESWSRRSRFFYRILFHRRPLFILLLLLVASDCCPLICDNPVFKSIFHSSCRWSLIESEKYFNSSSSNVLWLTLFISINKFIQNNIGHCLAISLKKIYEISQTWSNGFLN